MGSLGAGVPHPLPGWQLQGHIAVHGTYSTCCLDTKRHNCVENNMEHQHTPQAPLQRTHRSALFLPEPHAGPATASHFTDHWCVQGGVPPLAPAAVIHCCQLARHLVQRQGHHTRSQPAPATAGAAAAAAPAPAGHRDVKEGVASWLVRSDRRRLTHSMCAARQVVRMLHASVP